MKNSKYSWENESDKISKRLVSQDEEEFLSKRRARELFDNEILKNIQVGTFEGLKEIHQNNFEEIVEKYVEMNIMHPFYEGNGRATRIWLDQMLIKRLGMCIDWQKINRNYYLSAMKRSVVNDLELKFLLKESLTSGIEDRAVFMNGINKSYEYENMGKYDVKELEELD